MHELCLKADHGVPTQRLAYGGAAKEPYLSSVARQAETVPSLTEASKAGRGHGPWPSRRAGQKSICAI
jgi:hypothetical protein